MIRLHTTDRDNDGPYAVLFQTHLANRLIQEHLEQLVGQVGLGRDVYLLIDQRSDYDEISKRLCQTRYPLPVVVSDIFEMYKQSFGHKAKSTKVAFYHTEYTPMVQFLLQNSQYKGAYRIEYDVRYTGDWGKLMTQLEGKEFEDFGYKAMCLVDHDDYKFHWPHWRKYRGPFKRNMLARAYNGFCYLSREAAKVLATPMNHSGHYELILPSVLKNSGQRIMDIGAYSKYTPPQLWGKHYISYVGTGARCTDFPHTYSAFGNYFDAMMHEKMDPNLIYHPVKVPKHLVENYKLS